MTSEGEYRRENKLKRKKSTNRKKRRNDLTGEDDSLEAYVEECLG